MDVVGAPVDGQFLQQVDAHLAAHLGQAARTQVVSADGVDVGLLHQRQVALQPLARRVQAMLGMEAEMIDAAELDELPVQPRTLRTQIEAPEPSAVRVVHRVLALDLHPEGHRVEVRVLVGHGLASGVGNRHRHAAHARQRIEIAHPHAAAHGTAGQRVVQFRDQVVVVELAVAGGVQVGGLGQAGELAAVAHHVHAQVFVFAQQADGDEGLLAGDHLVGHVELDRGQGAEVLAEEVAVDVETAGREDTVEAQVDAAAGPLRRDCHVVAHDRAVVIVNVRLLDAVPVRDRLALGLGVGVEDLAGLGHGFPGGVARARRRQLFLGGIERPALDSPLAVQADLQRGVFGHGHRARRADLGETAVGKAEPFGRCRGELPADDIIAVNEDRHRFFLG